MVTLAQVSASSASYPVAFGTAGLAVAVSVLLVYWVRVEPPRIADLDVPE